MQRKIAQGTTLVKRLAKFAHKRLEDPTTAVVFAVIATSLLIYFAPSWGKQLFIIYLAFVIWNALFSLISSGGSELQKTPRLGVTVIEKGHAYLLHFTAIVAAAVVSSTVAEWAIRTWMPAISHDFSGSVLVGVVFAGLVMFDMDIRNRKK